MSTFRFHDISCGWPSYHPPPFSGPGLDLCAQEGDPLELLGHAGRAGQLQCAGQLAGRPRFAAGAVRLGAGFDRAAQNQEGAELLPRLAVPPALEADRGGVHPVAARGKHAQAEPSRVQHGRGGGGVPRAAGGAGRVLPAPVQNGGQLEAAALLARGRQLDLSQLGDGSVPAPDIPEGIDLTAGVVANASAW